MKSVACTGCAASGATTVVARRVNAGSHMSQVWESANKPKGARNLDDEIRP